MQGTSGIITCHNGQFQQVDNNFTCIPLNCDMPLSQFPSLGINVSTCSNPLLSGTTCNVVCDSGFTATVGLTSFTCNTGSFSVSDFSTFCSPNSCLQPIPSVNSKMTAGDCPPQMISGTSCELGCISQHQSAGDLRIICRNGVFLPYDNTYSTVPGFCIAVDNIFTTYSSTKNNNLVASPGTKLYVNYSISDSAANLIIDTYLNINGIEVIDGVPNIATDFSTFVPILTSISIESLYLNLQLTQSTKTFTYISKPIIASSCPDSIISKVNQTLSLKGMKISTSSEAKVLCILNNTYAFPPSSYDETSVSCIVNYPIEVNGTDEFLYVNVVNDGVIPSSSSSLSSAVKISLIGKCKTTKENSIAGENGCICDIGYYDPGGIFF